MNELYAVLMSWAVSLSGYTAPLDAPRIETVPHAVLVERACGGKECKVMGWFPPGNTIYLDERLNVRDNLHHASVVVHEMVHYLQHQTGEIDAHFSCGKAVDLEREAYGVQAEFLHRYGVYHPVGLSMKSVGCELTAHDVAE